MEERNRARHDKPRVALPKTFGEVEGERLQKVLTGPSPSSPTRPHLLSSLVAARLQHAEEAAVLGCAGRASATLTRIAASDPAMWIDILSANPGPVADVLAAVASDLDETVPGRCARSSPPTRPSAATARPVSRTCCAGATPGASGCRASTAPPRPCLRP
ncbi:hypothetical protein SANTM175S_03575 [Streptomyces antimycoticus]